MSKSADASKRHSRPTNPEHDSEHEFKGSWRWPPRFEAWVKSVFDDVDGRVINVFAGLSPLGDVRIDLKSPAELIENLQSDKHVDLKRARNCLQEFVKDDTPGDVIEPLFNADNPAAHPAAKYITTETTIKADVVSGSLPFEDNSFGGGGICDPPWKNVADKDHLFAEMVRVTKPGGKILFNAYWAPTGDYPITLDHIELRQDLERSQSGWPNGSWACVYTVHESIDLLKYPRSPLTIDKLQTPEFQPEANSLEELTRANVVFDLNRVHGIPLDDFDTDTVDPATTDHQCPQCGCSHLDPVGPSQTDTFDGGDLYECLDCEFRATQAEVKKNSSRNRTRPITQFADC